MSWSYIALYLRLLPKGSRVQPRISESHGSGVEVESIFLSTILKIHYLLIVNYNSDFFG
jgi:hypothetical protein